MISIYYYDKQVKYKSVTKISYKSNSIHTRIHSMAGISGIAYYSNIWTYRIILFVLFLWVVCFILFIHKLFLFL
jgi:hypothetical protein